MSSSPITSFEQVTPTWLTEVLRGAKVLKSGMVRSIHMEKTERELSKNAKLTVSYSLDSAGERPRYLFLKISSTNLDDEFLGPSEVNYYARDYVGITGLPLLRCYDAVFSPEREIYHVLLDDVSKTHETLWHQTPTMEFGLALAEGLGRMHAHWWDIPRLSEIEETLPTKYEIDKYVSIAKAGLDRMLGICKMEINYDWPEMMGIVFDRHPQKMLARTQDGNGFTLVHGDVSPENILAPKEGVAPIYLIDRQPFDWSLTTWLGVQDLAYLMGLYWAPPLRRSLENAVLRRYHDTLKKNGVIGYLWEHLFEDYRLSLLQNVYITVEWCRGRGCEDYKDFWFPMLKNSMQAVVDLDCMDILR